MTERPTANRLADEKSPYLLQHAHNPVDWYPWGEDAFARAAAEDKPVFLSIGYSTCHWCHVMEKESFQDREVAELMNRFLVSVKVDREERPDLDHIYMTVCQMLTGSGGWPLTVIMTPDKKPFFAGTYFPKRSRFGRMGMVDLIPRAAELWRTERDRAVSTAEEIVAGLRTGLSHRPGPDPGGELAEEAFREISNQHDDRHGGFGPAPKFPVPGHLHLLLRYWRRTGNETALSMVEKTLRSMRMGGIYDQVGFGFHRYSTDERWLLPHFEKMLYDQALIAMAYTEAFQATGKDEYRRTAKEIFTYVLRDMTDDAGGFFSAEDADSEGEEGKFYTWTAGEIETVLEPEEARTVREVYTVRDEGNFTAETGETDGTNILHLAADLETASRKLDMTEDGLVEVLEGARRKLFRQREGRVRPDRDEKILTDWNGLMIAALARGGGAFNLPRYTEAAERAAGFILDHLMDSSGRLHHRYIDGHIAVEGNLDDYAFFTWGLLEIYFATFKVPYLRRALDLTERMISLFWDEEAGGFFFTRRGEDPLSVGNKTATDGATPSGNSVAAMNLLRLSRLTSDPHLEERVAGIGRCFSRLLHRSPASAAVMVSTLAMAAEGSQEVAIVGDPDAPDTRDMVHSLREGFFPHTVSMLVPPGEEGTEITGLIPAAGAMKSLDGKATAYVCQGFACRNPTTDIDEMVRTIEAGERKP